MSAHLRPPRISTAPSRLKSLRTTAASGSTGSGPAATNPGGRQVRVLFRMSSNGVYRCPTHPTPTAAATVAIASALQLLLSARLAILVIRSDSTGETAQSLQPAADKHAASKQPPVCVIPRVVSHCLLCSWQLPGPRCRTPDGSQDLPSQVKRNRLWCDPPGHRQALQPTASPVGPLTRQWLCELLLLPAALKQRLCWLFRCAGAAVLALVGSRSLSPHAATRGRREIGR